MIDCLRLTYVPRWCIVPMRRPQSVAEHSYRVALIVGSYASKMGFNPALVNSLMAEALTHDKSEALSGDIPRSFKVAGNMGLYQEPVLSGARECLLRVADLYEAVTWVRSWGNGRRIPGIIHGLEEDLTKAVDRSEEIMPGFLAVYKEVSRQVEEEE